MLEYSRTPERFEDTDNIVEELTTDRSKATKPSTLSPESHPSGMRIVDEGPSTFAAPAAQGEIDMNKIFCNHPFDD